MLADRAMRHRRLWGAVWRVILFSALAAALLTGASVLGAGFPKEGRKGSPPAALTLASPLGPAGESVGTTAKAGPQPSSDDLGPSQRESTEAPPADLLPLITASSYIDDATPPD